MPLTGTYNYMTHVLLEQMLWLPIRDQINRWRRDTLGLPPAGITESSQSLLYQLSLRLKGYEDRIL